MNSGTVREKAKKMVDHLSDEATWDDLMQQIYVRKAVEAGLSDCQEGRMIEVGELRRQLGLDG